MSEVGAVGVGLSVAFAGFMVVVGVEVYLIWKSRKGRRRAEAMVAVGGARVEQRAVAMEGGRGMWVVEDSVWEWLCGGRRRRRMLGEHCGVEAALPPMGRNCPAAEFGVSVCGGEAECCEEEEDIFKIGGLLGPPRLLFTITEETTEEMDLEESRSRAGGGRASRRGSRASSELVPSAATSPFVTPPSSPPFATPMGSPPVATPYLAPVPPPKPLHIFADDSSSSSSSSFDTLTPPFATSPNTSRRPLSSLFEESSSTTSSSSSSNSSAATPATLSPPYLSAALSSSPKRLRRPPLSILFDPPPSPSSTLLHHRVHPLQPAPSPPSFRPHLADGTTAYQLLKLDSLSPTSPFRPVPHLPGMNIEGTPILNSPSANPKREPPPSFSKFLPPKSALLMSCPPANVSPPRFSSPASPLLRSALSSPFRVSPSNHPPGSPSSHVGRTDRTASEITSSTTSEGAKGFEV